MRNILIVGMSRSTGRWFSWFLQFFACTYFFLLFFWANEFWRMYVDMDFNLTEVLKTLSSGDEDLVPTNSKLSRFSFLLHTPIFFVNLMDLTLHAQEWSLIWRGLWILCPNRGIGVMLIPLLFL